MMTAHWSDLFAEATDLMMRERSALTRECDELHAKNGRLQAIVAEVRKLEAIDHGVAWPDLCHALYELDRSSC
jgi:hypothetical protein